MKDTRKRTLTFRFGNEKPRYSAFVCTENFPRNTNDFERNMNENLRKAYGAPVNVKYIHGVGDNAKNARKCMESVDYHFENVESNTNFQVDRKTFTDTGNVMALSWRNKEPISLLVSPNYRSESTISSNKSSLTVLSNYNQPNVSQPFILN